MRVLTFDPGLRMGYARIAPDMVPVSGSVAVPGSFERLGEAVHHCGQHVEAKVEEFRPDVIGYAETWIGKKSNMENIGLLSAFIGKINEVAYVRRIRCVKVEEYEARKFLMGVVPRTSNEIKKRAMAICHERGWPARDGHAADATVVGVFLLYDVLLPTLSLAAPPQITIGSKLRGAAQ